MKNTSERLCSQINEIRNEIMIDTKKQNGKNSNVKEYDFLRETLLPACAIFCVAVFIFFFVAMGVGINVTETKTEITTVYDNQTGINDTESPNTSPDALPVQTLLGIMLFCVALMLIGQIYRLDYSRLTLRMIHFALTVFSFFLFVLALPGYVSDTGLPAAIIACAAISVLYFIILGIKKLVMTVKPLRGETAEKIKAFILPAFGVFAALVFAVSFFNLITQVPVIVKEIIEEVWEQDDRVRTTYIRVATPLAPTLQNYLRYLVSGLVFMIGCAVLKMRLHAVAKAVLNFIILTAGYIGIWLVGMDYFRMVKANLVAAIVIYLAVYLVALITVCVIHAVKRRGLEDTEEYESQFRPGSTAAPKGADGEDGLF